MSNDQGETHGREADRGGFGFRVVFIPAASGDIAIQVRVSPAPPQFTDEYRTTIWPGATVGERLGLGGRIYKPSRITCDLFPGLEETGSDPETAMAHFRSAVIEVLKDHPDQLPRDAHLDSGPLDVETLPLF